MAPRLVLASGSPRRLELLRNAGWDFVCEAPEVDESPMAGESPGVMVARLAMAKATAVASPGAGSRIVLGADTTVVLDGMSLGKPADADDAMDTLLALSGRSHEVMSGYALVADAGETLAAGTVTTVVHMREISAAEAAAYAATGEPMGKAGAYAIQGDGGRFVELVEGSFTNVMGLPLEAVEQELRAAGLTPTGS